MLGETLNRSGLIAILALSGLVSIQATHADDDSTVTLTPFPAPTVTTFDPAHPPTNPPLPAGEDADTVERVGVTTGSPALTTTTTAADGTVTVRIAVTGPVPVTVTGSDTIRVPTPSSPPSASDNQLREHEDGHGALDANDYARNATAKTEAAFRGLKGTTFTGSATGANAAATATAQATAALTADLRARVARAVEGINSESQVLGDKYDDLTNHGQNDRGQIDTAAKSVAAALAERDRAPQPAAPHRRQIQTDPTRPRVLILPRYSTTRSRIVSHSVETPFCISQVTPQIRSLTSATSASIPYPSSA